MNPERVSMPDIDIDFCYVRRGEVIDYAVIQALWQRSGGADYYLRDDGGEGGYSRRGALEA